jgi:uncharacterized membrane protein
MAEELLRTLTEQVVPVIDLIALIVIAYGTLEAFVRSLVLALTRGAPAQGREIWIGYSHWLVAGLTFQLAADIIETSTAPSWDEIGKLAAIAVIRTALNYFLEHDQNEMRELRDRDRELREQAEREA